MIEGGEWVLPPVAPRPVPLAAGFADAFLLGYLAHASESARPYCEVDVRIVRSILGVPEYCDERDKPLIESCGCCLVAGIGMVPGGLSVLYWSPELGHHHLVIACQPWREPPVTVPTAEDPPL